MHFGNLLALRGTPGQMGQPGLNISAPVMLGPRLRHMCQHSPALHFIRAGPSLPLRHEHNDNGTPAGPAHVEYIGGGNQNRMNHGKNIIIERGNTFYLEKEKKVKKRLKINESTKVTTPVGETKMIGREATSYTPLVKKN
jgi:hypothetical protein